MSNRTIQILVSALSLFLFTGCIGGPGPEDFAGTWQGTETITFTTDGNSETDVLPQQTLVLTEGSSADIILDLSEENAPCILRGNIEDDILEFDSTSCTETNNGSTLTITFSGEAELDDEELLLELSGPVSVNTPNGNVAGTTLYKFEGERL